MGFELPRTRAVRRGAHLFYNDGESSYVAGQVVFDEPELAPPPPPPVPATIDKLGIAEPAMAPALPPSPPPLVPAHHNATAAANHHPVARPPRTGEEEA